MPVLLGYASITGFTLVGLYGAWVVWYRRRAGHELGEIRRIAAEFRGEEEPMYEFGGRADYLRENTLRGSRQRAPLMSRKGP